MTEKQGIYRHADMRECDFTGADLAGADFTGANLQGAVFYQADIHDANFTCANLQGAYFVQTNICGVVLTGANVKDTAFTECYWYGYELADAQCGTYAVMSSSKTVPHETVVESFDLSYVPGLQGLPNERLFRISDRRRRQPILRHRLIRF